MGQCPRLTYHFEPERGWINDPNGLCRFKGKYHVFAQHYPFAAKWGPMHWAHGESTDLIHWEEKPIALYPDMPYENDGGCFSGSALEKDGKLYLMYTSVSKERGQTQSMAVSEDGSRFVKLPGNPVIPQSPLDPANKDFRDPKMFAYGDEYRMVCGGGVNGLASVLLFRSRDLLSWEYVGPIFESREYGPVPECPDLFPLGDKWVLMFSRMDETRSAQFVVGQFDGEHFTPESFQQPEKGTDFYAPQTFLDEKGRRIMISWLYNWTRQVPQGALRAGALTIPRELSLREGKVINFPVEEAHALLTGEDPSIQREQGSVKLVSGGKTMLELPEEQVKTLDVLKDGNAREVFVNGGEFSCTYIVD